MGGGGLGGKGAIFPPVPLCSCSVLAVGVSQVAFFSHPRLSEVEVVSLEQSPLLTLPDLLQPWVFCPLRR